MKPVKAIVKGYPFKDGRGIDREKKTILAGKKYLPPAETPVYVIDEKTLNVLVSLLKTFSNAISEEKKAVIQHLKANLTKDQIRDIIEVEKDAI